MARHHNGLNYLQTSKALSNIFLCPFAASALLKIELNGWRAQLALAQAKQMRDGLLLDVFPCGDGHAQALRLVGAVARAARPGEVWIEDRNFRTLGLLADRAGREACAVVRQHGNLPLAEKPPFTLFLLPSRSKIT